MESAGREINLQREERKTIELVRTDFYPPRAER